jgi:sodium-dependent dicarboxylate transporter 2/3/5
MLPGVNQEQCLQRNTVSQGLSNDIMKKVGLFLGPTLAIAVFLMPEWPGLTSEGKRFFGLLLWIVIWWATGPVHYAVTSFIPIFGLPLLRIMKIKEAVVFQTVNGTANFSKFSLAAPTVVNPGTKVSVSIPGSTIGLADPTIIFFLGLLILSGAMVVSGLDKRMSYWIINVIGYSSKRLLLGITISSALVSTFIPNTLASAIHLPIVQVLLKQLRVNEDSNFAKAITLTISYASTLGGGSTITGRASLLVMVGMVESISGVKISYLDWMKVAFVFSWLMVFVCFWYLQRMFPLEDTAQKDAREVLREEMKALGPMTIQEKMVAVCFGLGIILFMTEKVWSKIPALSGMKGYLTVEVVALALPFLLFVIPISFSPLKFVISWKEISKHIKWDVILIFAAGLTIAQAVMNTGVADWSAKALVSFKISPVVFLIILTAFGSFLTEFISNTASMTLLLSIILPLYKTLGIEPVVLATTIALASEFTFMLPSGTPGNAIILGTAGVDIPTMIKAGFPLKVIVLVSWIIWSVIFLI